MGKREDKDAFRGLLFCKLIEWNWVSCGLHTGFHYHVMGCHIQPVDKGQSVRLSINYHIWKPCIFLPIGASKHNILFPFPSPNTFFPYYTLIKEQGGETGLCCWGQDKLCWAGKKKWSEHPREQRSFLEAFIFLPTPSCAVFFRISVKNC